MFVRTRTPRAVGLHVVFEALRDLHHVHAIFEENRLQLRVAEDLATVLRVLQILLVDITPHQARILQQSDLVCKKNLSSAAHIAPTERRKRLIDGKFLLIPGLLYPSALFPIPSLLFIPTPTSTSTLFPI